MPILRGPKNTVVIDLSEFEQNLGVDLKLSKDNDLILNNLSDFELISGGDNAAQAMKIRLFVEPGGVLFHPEIGTDLQIGSKTADAFQIQTQIIKSLSQDARFENVDATVEIEGDTIFVNLRVTLSNSGIEVPFQFAVNR